MKKNELTFKSCLFIRRDSNIPKEDYLQKFDIIKIHEKTFNFSRFDSKFEIFLIF